MAKGLAYTLGKNWKLVGIACVAVIAIGCWPEKQAPTPTAPVAATAAPATPEPDCTKDAEMLATYQQHIDKKEHWKAARTIAACAAKTGDPALVEKVRSGEAISREEDANNTKLSATDRLRAIEALKELDQAKADKLQPLVAKLQAAEKKEEAAAQRAMLAERKKQGVSVGMTAEEVLQSSWGKPSTINRTTTSFGVREQWVYGGNNYLYFKNGKLETIQN